MTEAGTLKIRRQAIAADLTLLTSLHDVVLGGDRLTGLKEAGFPDHVGLNMSAENGKKR
jgi:hypothetical protein